MNGRWWKWVRWIAAAVVMLPVAWFALGMQLQGGMGSMAEAQRLRPTVEAITDPTQLPPNDGRFEAIRFPNGEWVAGASRDSHGLYSQWMGGGTLVVKDSRGRVRCFFGHVCGGRRLGGVSYHADKAASLDEYYEKLVKDFAEQHWP